MHFRIQAGICLGLALTAASCGNQLPELDIEAQWRDAMRRQSMWSFFPLDEDVMVGDVFLHFRRDASARIVGNQADDSFELVRVARTPALDVALGLCDSLRERLPIAPPQIDEPVGADQQKRAARPVVAPRAACDSVRAADARRRRGERADLPSDVQVGDATSPSELRRIHAAIPKLTVARLTEGQLGASGLLGNFGANLGLGRGSSIALTIELTKLQQLQLEAPRAMEMLGRLIYSDTAERPQQVLQVLAQRAPSEVARICRGGPPGSTSPKVAIVTRVLYAGGIDYNFNQSNEFVAKLALDATSVLPNQQQNPQAPALGKEGALQPAAAGNAADLRERLNTLLTGLAGGPTGTAAGGNLRLAIGSMGNTTLKGDFPRALAVGAGSRLVFDAEDALLPHNLRDVDAAMRHCAGALSLRPPVVRLETDWCVVEGGRYVAPAGWGATAAVVPIQTRLCNFLRDRERERAIPRHQNEPLSPNIQPSGAVLTGVARGG